MARKAKAAAAEPIEDAEVDAGAAPDAAPVVEEAPPELWQELKLSEEYQGKDAAEIARDLRRQQLEAEQEFVRQRADAEIKAYQYANGAIRATPEWQAYEKWQAEQRAEQPQKKKWYDRPDFNPKVLRQYIDPETGEVDESKIPPDILERTLKFKEFKEQHDGRWENDREGYLDSYLDHALPGRFEKWEKEAKARWEEERDWQEWDRSNADWMYVHDKPTDQGGKRIIDPNTGRWALTQEGLTFHQIYNELRQDGISNSRAARDRATQIMLGILATQAPPQKQVVIQGNGDEPPQPKAAKHLDHIRAVAARTGGRGGSLPAAETPGKESQARLPKWEDTATANFAQRLGINAGA